MARSARSPGVARRPARVADASLLDIVDNVLNHGVVLEGDLILGVANIDLIYARISLLLSRIDRVVPPTKPPAGEAARGRPHSRKRR